MNKDLLMHRICKVLHTSLYFENNYGIKVYNKPVVPVPDSYLGEEFYIDPNQTCLGFDGLKDKYSLVGRDLKMSPHFQMIKSLFCGEDISECEYIKRETNGYLDGRYGIVPCDHKAAMETALNRINTGIYDPAIVYMIDDEWYILDGKHRLALCAVIDTKCKCRTLDTEFFKNDVYTYNLYMKMKNKESYELNKRLLAKMIESN